MKSVAEHLGQEGFPKGEFHFHGETVTETETVSVTKTVKRTYPQNWPAYNAAQTNEKDRFMILLRDLCAGLPEPEQKRGRPRLSVRDSVFTAVMKVYVRLLHVPPR